MATKKTNAQETTAIEIPGIRTETISVKLIGDSPLIVHAWSHKAKQEMLDKQMKRASTGKEAKDPFIDFCDSMYWLSEKPEKPTMEDVMTAKFGFPSVAFKAAAVDAGYQQGVLKVKTTARGAFHVIGEFVEIDGVPNIREDMVRIGMGTADIRFRGEFKQWSTTLHIKYNPQAISAEQIINLLNYGGFGCGVGEWRPQRDGSFGTFHVASGDE